MIVCAKCGRENPDTRKYCIGCNSMLSKGADSPSGRCIVGSFTLEEVGCGKFKLIECNDKAITEVSIPRNVTRIEVNAFTGCSRISEIIIPDGVTFIGEGAFCDCAKLHTIIIPASVTEIDSWIYDKGVRVIFEGTKKEWKAISGSQEKANVFFSDNPKGKKELVRLAEERKRARDLEIKQFSSEFNITALSNGTYKIVYCKTRELMEFHTPDWVSVISARTFVDCKSLRTVYIGEGIKQIEGGAFSNCPDIERFTVSGDNTNYSSDGNCLIERATGRIVAGCSSGVIPNDGSIKIIGKGAFYERQEMTEILLPEGITRIESDAFCGCSNVTSLFLPKSVCDISASAFNCCGSLAEITVDPENTTFYSKNNCVITKSSPKTLVFGCNSSIIPVDEGIEVIGEDAFSVCENIEKVDIPSGVRVIGDRSFFCCTGLEKISIPDTVVKIGEEAFASCSIDDVFLPSRKIDIGDYAFDSSARIRFPEVKPSAPPAPAKKESTPSPAPKTTATPAASVTPAKKESVKTDDPSKTLECEDLGGGKYKVIKSKLEDIKTVSLPAGVVEIADNAFYICKELSGVTFPSGLEKIGNRAFSYCESISSLTIPDSVTGIGEKAFMWCSSLSNIKLPKGLRVIERECFSSCAKLTGIELPTSLTEIGDRAFSSCSSIRSIILPQSLEAIGAGAFSGCEALESIQIPANVTVIGDEAFKNCKNLKAVNLPSRSISVGKDAIPSEALVTYGNATVPTPTSAPTLSFDSDPIPDVLECEAIGGGKYRLVKCKDIDIKKITIPRGVSEIGDKAFFYCKSLSELTIPDSVISIGEKAFSYCESLTKVVIPNSVTDIGNSAFSSCNGLKAVTLSGNLKTIGERTFLWCSSLTGVIIPNSVSVIGPEAFSGCESLASVTFPEALTKIEKGAFENCPLGSITLPNRSVSVAEKAFDQSTVIGYR